MATAKEHFTIDKKVPISVIVAIIAQVAVGIGFASVLVERVSRLEAKVSDMEGVNIRQEIMQQQLTRIEDKLDRFIERRQND